MCYAPNVYMFVYILIGTPMVPLTEKQTKKNSNKNSSTAKVHGFIAKKMCVTASLMKISFFPPDQKYFSIIIKMVMN